MRYLNLPNYTWYRMRRKWEFQKRIKSKLVQMSYHTKLFIFLLLYLYYVLTSEAICKFLIGRVRKKLEKMRPPNVTELLLTNNGDELLEGTITNFFVVGKVSVNFLKFHYLILVVATCGIWEYRNICIYSSGCVLLLLFWFRISYSIFSYSGLFDANFLEEKEKKKRAKASVIHFYMMLHLRNFF